MNGLISRIGRFLKYSKNLNHLLYIKNNRKKIKCKVANPKVCTSNKIRHSLADFLHFLPSRYSTNLLLIPTMFHYQMSRPKNAITKEKF